MSDVAFASIAASLATLFEDRIANQINRASVLLGLVPVANGPGKDLSWNARFGTAVGTHIADGADVAVFNNDDKVPAKLDYGTYYDAFAVTGKAMSAAANTRNPDELADLFGDELGDSVERLGKGVSQALYLGTGATDRIMGLCDNTAGAILDTGTYAGISRAARAQWAATVDTNGGTPRALTFDLMRTMRTNIYTASGLKPDLIVTTPAIHGKFGSLFGTNRRYVQDIILRGNKITLSGGYGALFFDDIPVVEDVDCPSGEMVFLNTRLMRVAQLPDPAQAIAQAMGSVTLQGTEEEQFGIVTGKISARINPLARSGDKFKFQLICYPQLQVKRCNAFGRIKDINAAL